MSNDLEYYDHNSTKAVTPLFSLNEANPIAALLWLLLTAGIGMFCLHPVLLAMSLAGAVLYLFALDPRAARRGLPLYLGMFALSALINPLFSHNGATPLFVLNNNPVTLEALLYGLALGAMIAASLCWFRAFQEVMTSDKLLYAFGSALPKLTLMLSIALRYIPLLREQSKRVRDAQTALGLFGEENLIDRLRGELRIFSVLVTWALENGIVTADSMAARGYGVGRRTRFALFRFQGRDIALCGICLALSVVTIAAVAAGALRCDFYPRVRLGEGGILSFAGYGCYALLTLAPAALEIAEKWRWKVLLAKV